MSELMDLWNSLRELHDIIRASFWLDAATLALVALLVLQCLGLRSSVRGLKRKVSKLVGS